MWKTSLTLALTLLLSGCVSADRSTGVTVIFKNGVVWTGVPQDRPVEAVAVRGERILALGTRSEIDALRSPDTRVVDLDGKFLMPGFIDNHTHFVSGGFQLLGIDLRSAPDEAEFARRIAEHAARLPDGQWILGGDWDHEAWPSRRIPRKELIDAATPRHPVFVNRLDGHMALANSLALQMAGVTRSTPDPPGGTIVRDENGEPAGVLKDAAMDLVFRVIPPPEEARVREAALTALEHARSLGVTTVNAMASFDEIRVLERLRKEGLLTSRIYAITPLPEFEKWRAAGVEKGFGGDRLKVGAVKGFVDGSLGSGTAWFYQPYLDAPETSGFPVEMWFPEGNLKRLVSEADAAGLHVVVHAIGDRANDALLDIYAQVAQEHGPGDRRFRIEHAQHLSPEAIGRFADLGVIASMQPYHAIDDGRWAENRIGPERARTTYAFRSLIDAGAVVTFGSDWSVAPLNPLLGVYAAVTRATIDGANPDGWVPEQKISPEEALVCYTKNNAYALFMERDLGTIEPGKLADLVVLSGDPRSVDPARIQDIQTLLTMVSGQTVFEK